jgi:endoglucanase
MKKLDLCPRSVVRALAATSLLLATACGSAGADASGAEPVQSATDGDRPVDTVNVLSTDVTTTSASGLSLTPTSPATPAAPAVGPMPYRGVNLAGAEFGNPLPGVDGRDYRFPNTAEVDYFVEKGMNTFRIGFKWERLQPAAYSELVTAYVTQLDALVAHATSKQATVILNPHNFARYYGTTVGSAQVPNEVFADLWRRLATRYGQNPRVMFNLVNEPNTMPTEQWVRAANAAIAAIRGAGALNTIVVPGNAWTGAHSWNSSSYGTPNAVAMLAIQDPANNTLYEVHQYLDANSGGGSGPCVSSTIGSERLADFVAWLRANGKKGFVGELAGRDDPTCNAAITDMMHYMMSQSDVLVGWLWWAAGPGWGNYAFSIEPKNGQDRPLMTNLKPFLF